MVHFQKVAQRIAQQPKTSLHQNVGNDPSQMQKIKASVHYWKESVKISMNRILSQTMKHIKVMKQY